MPESPIITFDRIVQVEPPRSARGLFNRVGVLGGSVAGLLAARVLADHAREVVIIERDDISVGGLSRAGVPQDRQGHGLLPGGLAQLERWLPGFTDEAQNLGGALAGPGQQAVYFDGQQKVSGSDTAILMATRPFLESRIGHHHGRAARRLLVGVPDWRTGPEHGRLAILRVAAGRRGRGMDDVRWRRRCPPGCHRGQGSTQDVQQQRWGMEQLLRASLYDATISAAFDSVAFMMRHPFTLGDPALIERAIAVNQQLSSSGRPPVRRPPQRAVRRHSDFPGVLSREAGQVGEGLVDGVGHALAEQAPERLFSRGGLTADAGRVGRHPCLDHVEELPRWFPASRRRRGNGRDDGAWPRSQ
jgi:hypothetical protein